MTEEELEKKAKKYELETWGMGNEKLQEAYKDGFNDGYSDGYEIGKKNERELQCGKKHLENLAKENEALKKSSLVWHKVTCFSKPDENGYITTDNPVEEGKEYLLKPSMALRLILLTITIQASFLTTTGARLRHGLNCRR